MAQGGQLALVEGPGRRHDEGVQGPQAQQAGPHRRHHPDDAPDEDPALGRAGGAGSHVADPKSSAIFAEFPRILGNAALAHHIADTLTLIVVSSGTLEVHAVVDDANFSMFRMGTTILTPQAADLIAAIGQALVSDKGGLTLRGHTDALPYKEGIAGNNWSLSAGRAEATRQALMRDGIGEDRFRRIEGVADKELLIPADPHNPRNRRISITVLD